MTLPLPARLCALPLAALCFGASAMPVTLSNAGYWLETVGSNTIGIAGGGAPGGVVTALFDVFAAPSGAAGTTATADYGGVSTSAPTVQANPSEFAKRVINPSTAQLQPLTVVFQNGPDTASITTGSLIGITPMPLVQGLAVDASAHAFSPTVSWSLPALAGFDIDAVQLVFYSNTTNLEIGNRVTLAPGATTFTFASALSAGLDLTINVRLYDLKDSQVPLGDSGNILASSRAYVNYTVPAVPEPASVALLALGFGALGLMQARRRRRDGEAAPGQE